MAKSSTESSDSEEDRKQRDAFAARLRKKDKENTRKITTSHSGLYDCCFNLLFIIILL